MALSCSMLLVIITSAMVEVVWSVRFVCHSFCHSVSLSVIIIIIIIIINKKINVAFSRRTTRTRNSHKKHKPRKRRV